MAFGFSNSTAWIERVSGPARKQNGNANFGPKKATPADLKVKKEDETKSDPTEDEEFDGDEAEREQRKKTSLDSDLTFSENARKIVMPLWNVPLKQQAKEKQEKAKASMDTLMSDILKVNPKLQYPMKKQKKGGGSDLYEFGNIRTAPAASSYLNRYRFFIGQSAEKKETAVGVSLYTEEDGTTIIGSPEDLYNLPDKMKIAAKVFGKYLSASDKPPFNKKTNTGFWHQLVARMSTNEALLLVIVCNQGTLNETALHRIKENLLDFFISGEGKFCGVNSVHLQVFRGKKFSRKQALPLRHVMGASHLEEKVSSLALRISPMTFFHQNTAGAEVLYKTIADLVTLREDSTTLLDLCCGAGPIGLGLAKKCLELIGVDVDPQAIQDCSANAVANNIRNYKYLPGKLKDVLPTIMDHIKGKYVVAILDLPMTRETQSARLLRSIPLLGEIIVIASRVKASTAFIQDLCKVEFQGYPFMPIKSIPVDLQPHTNEYEVVMLMKRRIAPPRVAKPVPEKIEPLMTKRTMPYPGPDPVMDKRLRMDVRDVRPHEYDKEYERMLREREMYERERRADLRGGMDLRGVDSYAEQGIGYRRSALEVPDRANPLISSVLHRTDMKQQLVDALRDELRAEVRKEVVQELEREEFTRRVYPTSTLPATSRPVRLMDDLDYGFGSRAAPRVWDDNYLTTGSRNIPLQARGRSSALDAIATQRTVRGGKPFW